ncbi:MAG: 2TM domain-containing protein [Dehalococcoidia bacterium]|nr:MAG: 2TM domain-containing protein [Dehalococcoidia bacterium]
MHDNDTMELRKAYERAEKIVSEKIGFLRHLAIFVVVNLVLLVINLLTSDFLWFLIPLGAWGILLLAHFVSVYMFKGERFERWRSREVEKEMDKIRKKS